jgi:hypothetical protein
LQVSYTPAGTETLAAISEELSAAVDTKDEPPEVSFSESVAGRETLAAIQHQLEPMRAQQTTLSYGDRLSNAPGARTPSFAPRVPHAKAAPLASSPEITMSQTAMGRETLAAIASELAPSSGPRASVPDRASLPDRAHDEHPSRPTPASEPTPFAIFEMMTFVVQGSEATQLSSEALRRRFVERHLLHRLPAARMDSVDRIDVTPWTQRDTVVVRIWCRLDASGQS